MVLISSLPNILSSRAFSTFKIFPFKGKIAWNVLSLPCLAEPPAESPSTKYNSLNAGSFCEQSANFPGSPLPSSAPLRRVSSRALRAASRALEAVITFSMIFLPTEGFSSKNAERASSVADATTPSTSEFPNFVFVCPSNCGFGILTLTTAVSPSRVSSPVIVAPSFNSFFSLA